jgi:FkbM family methyltransferase
MNEKLGLFFLKTINRFFIRKGKGKTSHQEAFNYMLEASLEGKYFGYAGNVNDGGEIAVLDLVNAVFQNQKITIFDVGANKGQYQEMLLAQIKLPDFRIFSFEPSPYTFSLLEKNIKPNVHNVNLGLGSKEETLTLHRTGPGSPLSSLYKKTNIDYYKVDMSDSEQVRITTLDAFCHDQKIEHIHFLKMDVEGHEVAVLNGASHYLSGEKIDIIQFEFGPPNIDSRSYLRDFFLLLPGYRIYRIVKDGLVEITYSEKEEIFIPINYLAISNRVQIPASFSRIRTKR